MSDEIELKQVKTLVWIAVAAAGVSLILTVIDNMVKNRVLAEANALRELLDQAGAHGIRSAHTAADGYRQSRRGGNIGRGDGVVPNPAVAAQNGDGTRGGGIKTAPRPASPPVRPRLHGDRAEDRPEIVWPAVPPVSNAGHDSPPGNHDEGDVSAASQGHVGSTA